MEKPKEFKGMPRPPKDIKTWMLKNVVKRRYLIYNRKKGMVYCTGCGETYKIEDRYEIVKHNKKTSCPYCGGPAVYKEEHYGRANLAEYGRLLVFVKRGKSIYASLTQFQIDFKERMPEIFINVSDIYKFNKKEQLRYKIDTMHGWYPCKNIAVPEMSFGGYYYNNKYDSISTYDCNFKEVFGKTDFKYSYIPEFMESLDPRELIRYVDLASKHKSVELLVKAGFESIVKAKINGRQGSRAIKWKKDNLKEILGLNKAEMKIVKQRKLNMYDLEIYKKVKKLGINISIKECEYISMDVLKIMENISKYENLNKIYKYIKKQELVTELGIYITATDYRDYISECEKLGLDLKLKNILFPKNLAVAHERTSKEIKIIASKEEKRRIKAQIEKVKKFNYSDGNLLIRVANSAEEIIEEGKRMNNCVGGYIGEVAKSNTNIFFVRRMVNPEEEFYTLELGYKYETKELELKQCRGKAKAKYGKQPDMTDEVKAFVDKWINNVVSKKKSKKVLKVINKKKGAA